MNRWSESSWIRGSFGSIRSSGFSWAFIYPLPIASLPAGTSQPGQTSRDPRALPGGDGPNTIASEAVCVDLYTRDEFPDEALARISHLQPWVSARPAP